MDKKQEILQRKMALSEVIVAFCRFLRDQGFIITPIDQAEALQALLLVNPFYAKREMMHCLKASIVKRKRDLDRFDDLFYQFIHEQEKAQNSKLQHKQKAKPKTKQQPSLESIKSWLLGNHQTDEVDMARFSPNEILLKKEFINISEDELAEMEALIEMIAKTIARQWKRRYFSERNGKFDLRNTIRASLSKGGEILKISRKNRKKNRMKLLLFCDVSRSMDLYSRFFIQFIYAFQRYYKRIETFAFSTSLHRITKVLEEESFEDAMERLSEEHGIWSGGTKIGESLFRFTKDYSYLLNQQTLVLIISDGWDTGGEAALEMAMRHIKSKSKKVIWLNPLAGNKAFEPLTKAMQIALPFIDYMGAAHNAESLKKAALLMK